MDKKKFEFYLSYEVTMPRETVIEVQADSLEEATQKLQKEIWESNNRNYFNDPDILDLELFRKDVESDISAVTVEYNYDEEAYYDKFGCNVMDENYKEIAVYNNNTKKFETL